MTSISATSEPKENNLEETKITENINHSTNAYLPNYTDNNDSVSNCKDNFEDTSKDVAIDQSEVHISLSGVDQMKPSTNPEDIIHEMGACGRFQVLLSFIIHFMKISVVFTIYVMPLAAVVPKWWCVDNELFQPRESQLKMFNFSGSEGFEEYNYTIMSMTPNTSDTYTFNVPKLWVNISETDTNKSSNDEEYFRKCMNAEGTACKNIRYDESIWTMFNEWDLACNLPWVPSMIASLQMTGLFIGNIASGQLADLIGRKKPLFLSLLILVVGNAVGYFSRSWQVFGLARIICGVGMGWYLTLQYTLQTEVTLSRIRAWVIAIPSWPLERCMFILVAFLLPNWRALHLVCLGVTLPFLLAWWFIPESFRWYLSHDRKSEAQDVVQYISKFNGHQADEQTIRELLDGLPVESGKTNEKKYTLLDLFRSKAMMKVSILSALNWFTLGLVSYSILFAIQALSGNYFLNSVLFTIANIPSQLFNVYLCNTIGRRRSVMLIFLLTGIGGVMVGVVQYLDTDMKPSLTNGFAMFTSFGIGMAWGAVQLITIELYPTVIRNIGYGFMNTFARIGAVIGPQLAYLDTQYAGMMYYICGGFALACVLGTYALPETKDKDLKDNIEHKNYKHGASDVK